MSDHRITQRHAEYNSITDVLRVGPEHTVPMTTDAKQVPPALSAEEWAELAPTIPLLRLSARRDGSPEAGLALANAALPDDSPYKITRADVEALAEGKESARRRLMAEGYDFKNGSDVIAALDALAAKLAALLPPHE